MRHAGKTAWARGIASAAAVGFSALALAPYPLRAQAAPDPDAVVDAFEKATGVHPGYRRNHAKGVCATGVFRGAEAARALSASAMFSGEDVPVLARFSVAGPNPEIGDAARAPHGMALQFQLPGGSQQTFSMIHAPFFLAATPAEFFEKQQVDLPDPATGKPDPAKGAAFLAAHPAAKAWTDWFGAHTAPASYVETTYNSLDAFFFVDAKGEKHPVRWRFAPKDGERWLTEAEFASAPKTFLEPGLIERLGKGPAVWTMIVTLGEPGDPIDNPTMLWPAGRREIEAGTLTLTKAEPQAEGACGPTLFDPNLDAAGIEPTPDPILAFRSLAYGVSYGRRTIENSK